MALRLPWRSQPPNISHLILVQFEEVFTLSSRRPGAEDEVRDALAILLQRAIPAPISPLIVEHDTFVDYFDPDSTPVRVILALRDDYVYALNRWRRHLPRLGDLLRAQKSLAPALERHRGALIIHQKLLTKHPEDFHCQLMLFISYDRVGDALRAQGDLVGALKPCRDSLAIAEKLADQDPSNLNWQSHLSEIYRGVGGLLLHQGDLARALGW